MKLVKFSVSNFRSIEGAYNLPLGDYAVLVGPNNEGKSNVLKAISIALTLLSTGHARQPRRRMLPRYMYHESDGFDYRWERDYPIHLQKNMQDGRSEFSLEFELSSEDFENFKKQLHSNLSTNLRIKLGLGRDDAKFEVILQGRGKERLSKQLENIATFVRERLLIQYIPSIRTSELAESVVEDIIERELSQLENDQNYMRLIDQLTAAQKPILDHISGELTRTVSDFVPDINKMTIESQSRLRGMVRRSYQVMVDDGANTVLDLKGNGVKSLTAISLLRHVSRAALGQRSLFLAIEEPESHLHPRAIHRLRQVLQEIAGTHQAILSTHSPVLIDRANLKQNIIVKSNKASAARNISEIRDALGVELSDNLAGAYLVLLVEGQEDKIVLEKWLSALSPNISADLREGLLTIDSLGGASALRYKTSMYKNMLCNVHAFLDHDEQGRRSIQDAETKSAIEMQEYHMSICEGMDNSELEDLIKLDTYEEIVQRKFGVMLNCKYMKTNKKKWSERMRDCFINQGKPWNDKIQKQLKSAVAEAAAAEGIVSLNENRDGSIRSLVNALEARMKRA